jgi:elongation of very long chain fatty acids protein 4
VGLASWFSCDRWEVWYEEMMALGDPRVENWLLMATPWPTLIIIAVYIVMSVTAPSILRGRTIPCKAPILAYNAFLVVLNCYMAYELIINTWHYNWQCDEVDYSKDEGAMRVASALWWFYFSKVIEMLDTVFFICKGNYRQLSFLHIHHHSTIFWLWWIGVKFVAGGGAVAGGLINSVIHIVMYSYYFVAALGPQYKKYLGWKKFLTLMQISQFWIDLGLAINTIVYHPGCNFPKWMLYGFVGYMTSFIFLFSNFFFINYLKGKEAPAAKDGKKSQ